MATFNIPTTTYAVGTTTVGPVATAATSATFIINRTGSGNHPWLNSLTSASVMDVQIQYSSDGVNWTTVGEDSTIGGTYTARGTTLTTWELDCTWPSAGSKANVQALVTVSGPSSVTISGSITTA